MAEFEVISQSGDKASVNAVVKNANYYAIDKDEVVVDFSYDDLIPYSK